MPAKLANALYKSLMHHANIKKNFITIRDGNNKVEFGYVEKGHYVDEQPSIVFVHGFSSNKYTWLRIMKDIPDYIHCIAIDMPFHGETTGFSHEQLESQHIVETLHQLFTELGLKKPICLVGTSMGGSLTAMYAARYPSCVFMISLLAPVPPGKQFETELLAHLEQGQFNEILPETREQFVEAAGTFSMKKYHFRRLLAKEYLKMQAALVDEQKMLLKASFEKEYPHLGESYEQLKRVSCPSLIIWGKQDKLCTSAAAQYFADLLSNSRVILLDNCGHLIPNDKPKETAQAIYDVWCINRPTSETF